MAEAEILKSLIDDKLVKVVKLYVNNPDQEFYLREVSKKTGVSPASTHRILKKLTKKKILIKNKKKHLITYKINKKNSDMFFNVFEDRKNAIETFKNYVKGLENVEKIVLTGKSDKNKASILIVGNTDKNDAIRLKTLEIKEKYGFKIIHLIISKNQYEQMDMMGMHGGNTKILYSKK